MADNSIRGRHVLKYDKDSFSFFYGWDEIAILEKKLGTGYVSLSGDAEKLAIMATLGLQEERPGLTEEQFKAFNIPILHVQAAVLRALRYAYNGDNEPIKGETPDDMVAAQRGEAKKKSLLSKKLSRLAFWRASPRMNSGT